MEMQELLEIISRNEDSKHQFKADVTNETSLSQEMVAFSNSGGGSLFIGIKDDGSFANLGRDDMGRLNQLVSNAASQQVRPPDQHIRNPILASFATKILPYRGLGSGITRALKAHPHIQFEDNRDGNFFKVTIERTN